MRFFFGDGCPYAHRTRALLTLLEQPFEPVVINEYLAEKFAWPDAFSADVKERARERLVMKRFDELLVPLFFASLKNPGALDAKPGWKREVEILGETVKGKSPRSLLGLHLVTHWLRMKWLAPESPLQQKLGLNS